MLVDNDRSVIGYANLAKAVIWSSLNPLGTGNELLRQKNINLKFVENSKLVQHFCDVFELDEVRVKKAIIRVNQ